MGCIFFFISFVILALNPNKDHDFHDSLMKYLNFQDFRDSVMEFYELHDFRNSGME